MAEVQQIMESLKAITETLTKMNIGYADPPKKADDDGKNKGTKKALDDKFLKKMNKFASQPGGWSDWRFQTRIAIGSADPKIVKVLEAVEKREAEVTEEVMREWQVAAPGGEDGEWSTAEGYFAEAWSRELYEVLSLMVTGEALTLVKSVSTGNGFEAWRKLFAHFNPTTPARALHALLELVMVKKVEKETDLIMKSEEWLIKSRGVADDFGERMSENMMIAILTGMCPDAVRDIILQQADTFKTAKAFVEKLQIIVMNRTAMTDGRVPMDVGGVGGEEQGPWQEDGWGDGMWEEGQEIEYM